MSELTMPRLSDTMLEGTLARWLKQPGDRVERGDVVAEIETDKATMELEAYESGVLETILVAEGQTVPIGQPIALIGTGAVAAPASAPAVARVTVPSPEPPQPSAGLPLRAEPEAGAVRASPMARAMARERGIDLRSIQGSGPAGRVIRADLESLPFATPSAPPAAAPAPTEVDDVEEIPLSSIRRVVARRMLESVQTVPHFMLTTRVDVEALLALRADLNARLAGEGNDLKLSLNDLLIRACALTLRAHPDVNVSFSGDKILRYRRIHIGLAVAAPAGLMVPVLRDADRKSVGQIARETRALIDRARAGRLAPDLLTGGTFTISNLGMYDVEQFSAIINLPQAAILAVASAAPEVVAYQGQPAVRQTMRLTLSVDHRALDGATAAAMLQSLKVLLQAPIPLVVQTQEW